MIFQTTKILPKLTGGQDNIKYDISRFQLNKSDVLF